MEAGGILRCGRRSRERGNGEVAEIAQPAGGRRASLPDAAGARAYALPPLAEISAPEWRALSRERFAEPIPILFDLHDFGKEPVNGLTPSGCTFLLLI